MISILYRKARLSVKKHEVFFFSFFLKKKMVIYLLKSINFFWKTTGMVAEMPFKPRMCVKNGRQCQVLWNLL